MIAHLVAARARSGTLDLEDASQCTEPRNIEKLTGLGFATQPRSQMWISEAWAQTGFMASMLPAMAWFSRWLAIFASATPPTVVGK